MPQGHVRVVEDDALMRRRPTNFYAREIFIVAEEIVETLERIGWITVRVCNAGNHVHVVGQHRAIGNADCGIVRQTDACTTGTECKIHEVQPGAGKCECVDVIRGIKNAGNQRRPATIQTLPPVQVLRPEIGIVERRLLQANIANLPQRKIERRRAAVGMAMLEFPDQRASALIHEIPGAVNSGNAPCSGIVGKRITRGQQDTRVVDTEAETMIVFKAFLPFIPGLAVLVHLIFDSVGPTEFGTAGLLCSDTRGNYRQH